MKIAFVSTITNWPWGGADALWTRAAEGAVERGDTVMLALSPLTADHPRIARLQAGGVSVFLRPVAPAQPSLASRTLRRFHLSRPEQDPLPAALEHFAPDRVVISCGGTYDLVAEPALSAWLGRGHPYRVIANFQHEHPHLPEELRRAARQLLAAAEAVYFLSHRNLETTRRHLPHALPAASVVQIPLRWQEADATPWPAAPPWRLAAVARLSPEKGLPLLLHSAARVLGGQDGWLLRLYGRGPEAAHLHELVAFLGLGDRVEFAGFVGNLRDVWADNHLFVSPALDEGVPMTIPEAMLCGRPVLATAVGGAEEWISHGQTGFLCPAPNQPLFDATLREAWAAREAWAGLGAAAAHNARRHYRPHDWQQVIA